MFFLSGPTTIWDSSVTALSGSGRASIGSDSVYSDEIKKPARLITEYEVIKSADGMKDQQKNKFELHSADQNESALFFSGQKDYDARLGCVGHFRSDFGNKGKEFWHIWFDHIS